MSAAPAAPLPATPARRLYSSRDILRILGISHSTLDALIAQGVLPTPVRLNGPRGRRYWTVESIERRLAELSRGQPA
jgi:predicted DNA-binding transcriptional regulator AlpA